METYVYLYNFSIGLLPEDIAIFHALYRTSIKGRRDFLKAVVTNRKLGPALDDYYVSRVAEIYKVKMKALGVGVDFIDEDSVMVPLNDDIISPHSFKGKEVLCTNYQYYVLKVEDRIRDEIFQRNPVITRGELERLIKKELKERFFVNNVEYDEDGDLLLDKIAKDL